MYFFYAKISCIHEQCDLLPGKPDLFLFLSFVFCCYFLKLKLYSSDGEIKLVILVLAYQLSFWFIF